MSTYYNGLMNNFHLQKINLLLINFQREDMNNFKVLNDLYEKLYVNVYKHINIIF